MGQLDGKVAVITGAASGIGLATAEVFVAEGARVVIGDMQVEKGQAVCDRLGEATRFVATDVRFESQVENLMQTAVDAYGGLDIVFNNAGFGGVLGPISDTDVDEFDLTFDVLVRGVFLGTKHAARRINDGGSIINTGSVAALQAGYGPHAYSAAKAAVVQLTRSVAMEMASRRIRVNAICPGLIATPLSANTVGRSDDLVEAAKPHNVGAQPIPIAGEPIDIASMALFLASDASRFVTGQAQVVDGGKLTGRSWEDQPAIFKMARPVKVYRPD